VQTSTSMVQPASNGWAVDDEGEKPIACHRSPRAIGPTAMNDQYKTQPRDGGTIPATFLLEPGARPQERVRRAAQAALTPSSRRRATTHTTIG